MLYYPVGQKFARNRSISYHFEDIFNVNFTTKIQDGRLCLTVFEIFTLFHFLLKYKMAAKSGENCNFSLLHRTLLYYPVGEKFAQNRSISYGF